MGSVHPGVDSRVKPKVRCLTAIEVERGIAARPVGKAARLVFGERAEEEK
jgi:hypothetical protein